MRNVLIHAYFKIDSETVWSAVQDSLPMLEQQIRTWLAE